MNNLPSLDDMLAAVDAEAAKAQEAWKGVLLLAHQQMKREADALNAAKLALHDGAALREKLTATFSMAEKELAEAQNLAGK